MDPKAVAAALASPDFGVGANPVLQIDPMAAALQQQGGVGLPAATTPAAPVSIRPKVNLQRLHEEEGELGGPAREYSIITEATKQPVGSLSTDFDPATNRLYIPWIGLTSEGLTHFGKTWDPAKSMYEFAPNTLGPANVRSMFRALMKEHPEAEKIIGERVSGAREAFEERTGTKNPTKWFTMQVKKPKAE